MKFDRILEEFAGTWRIFLKVPLPFGRSSVPEEAPESARVLMPVVGAVWGLALALPVWIAGVVFSKIAAGLVGAIYCSLACEFATSFAGTKALASFLEARRKGFSTEEALIAPLDDKAESGVLFVTIYILKLAMFGILGYAGAEFWLVAAFGCVYFVKSDLCSLNTPGNFGSSWFETPEHMKKWPVYTAVGVMVLAGIPWNIPYTVAGLCVAWLVGWFAKGIVLESISGISTRALNVFSSLAELVLLFLGILFFVKG